MGLDLRSSELERTFMKERVGGVETHFLKISSKLTSYVNKLATLRDSGDEVAKSISDFASKETYNQTLRLSLGKFSDVLSSIEEYRDAQVKRTKVKVIDELDNYNSICKQSKVEIKKCFDAREKEFKRKADLEKMRSKNPHSWQKIEKAEKELNQARDEATRCTERLSMQIEHFERKKIEDYKKLFLEFVRIEMIFHCKAIELYTEANTILNEIETEQDLNEFQSHFKAHESAMNMTSPSLHNSATLPKTLDSDGKDENDHEPQVLKSIQEKHRSSMNVTQLSPHHTPTTLLKCNYSDEEDSSSPHKSRGIQERHRSIFTLQSAMANGENLSSSSGTSIESKFVH